jgi:signal transduction histidine kinase
MLVHDLKSPLSGLRLALEDALESGTVRPRLVEAANAQVDKVIAYLNELLDVFRAESQGMELVEEDLSSGSLLEGIAEDFRPQADRKGIELRVTLPPGLPSLKADARKLERAFNNLLANALKFTPEGGIIGLRASVQEGNGLDAGIRWLSVELADSGRGIPAEKLPLIFNPYHQAFHSDSDSGTGLGLAIVARIVAAHHGRIQVQSREAVGSCFTILLPLQPDDQTPTQPDP